MAKVLIFQANPLETTLLRLNAEMRSIQEAAESNGFYNLEIQFIGAVRKDDIQVSLIRYAPDIVHFCGHGSKQGLIMEDSDGHATIIKGKELSAIFSNFSDTVKCVILNSCYSEPQANEINKYVPCIVGMTSALDDQSAISFSSKFYTGLASGYSVKRAFDIAKTEMYIYNSNDRNKPVLRVKRNIKAEDLFISLTPSIRAKFKHAVPKADSGGHYKLEVFVSDVPSHIRSVLINLNDENLEYDNAFDESFSRLLGYSMETKLYGDIEIRAMLWKNDGTGIGISSTLVRALRHYYMTQNPSTKILNAIKEIEKY